MTKASDNVFPRFLISEGGSTATPAAGRVTVYAKANGLLYSKDDAGAETALGGGSGSVATDAIWAAQGDIAVATANDAAAVLTKGAAGTVLTAGASTLAYAYPPGYEFDYAQITTGDVTVASTTAGSGTTIVTGGAVTYDGSTAVLIEFYSPQAQLPGVANCYVGIELYDNGTVVGNLGVVLNGATTAMRVPVRLALRRTPSNAAHTFSVRAYRDGGGSTLAIGSGALGSGTVGPAFIRITKA